MWLAQFVCAPQFFKTPKGLCGHAVYANRALNKAERNYSTVETELTAVVWSCKQFRPHIWRRKFTVVTDHKPLTWIVKMNIPSLRIINRIKRFKQSQYTRMTAVIFTQ
jgi:hypothetical protein